MRRSFLIAVTVALGAILFITAVTSDAAVRRPVSAGAAALIKKAGLPLPSSTMSPAAPIPTVPKNLPPVNNQWRNLGTFNGSLNCLVEARQPSADLVIVRKTAGKCSNLGVETYIYNSEFMADLDYYNGLVPNGRLFEGRAPFGQRICYVYVHWRDGVGAYKDALYVRGGRIV